MNEAAARHVVLIRALETTDSPDKPWNDSDATWASRAAAEVVGSEADADRFLARRGALAVERLGDRDRRFRRLAEGRNWRPWVGTLLVAVAFALGILMDAVGPSRYVNLLAFPLLGLIAWNLLVYLAIVAEALTRPFRSTARRPGALRRAVARLGGSLGDIPVTAAAASPSTVFRRDWAQASAPLTLQRVSQVLHLSAMAFALGAITALYMRGLVLDYRAGWESTFLEASQVHHGLSLILGPAARLAGLPIPNALHLEGLRLPGGSGENAAPWIHLFALTLAFTVVLPRALLALVSGLRARNMQNRFPLPLGDAYFQRLQRSYSGREARVHVLPYSYDVSPAAALLLQEAVTREFGPRASLAVAPAVAFGDEDALPPGALPGTPPSLVLALFSLTATPEDENHGAFLTALAAQLPPDTPLAALVDEAGFKARFDTHPKRQEERRQVWARVLEKHAVGFAFVDLDATDPAALAETLSGILERSVRTGDFR
jgi:hypothetical protein